MNKKELEKELDEAYRNFWKADGKVRELLNRLKSLDKTKNLSKLIGKCYKTSKVDNYFKIIDTTAPHGHLVLIHIKNLSISIEKMTEPSFYAQEIGAITKEEFNKAYENTKEELQKCIEKQ